MRRLLCLLLAWLTSYACLARGLSSSKRLVYVASIFPYAILALLFLKALSLRGMAAGVSYLFEPEVSSRREPAAPRPESRAN